MNHGSNGSRWIQRIQRTALTTCTAPLCSLQQQSFAPGLLNINNYSKDLEIFQALQLDLGSTKLHYPHQVLLGFMRAALDLFHQWKILNALPPLRARNPRALMTR